jgi:hypothetical protein
MGCCNKFAASVPSGLKVAHVDQKHRNRMVGLQNIRLHVPKQCGGGLSRLSFVSFGEDILSWYNLSPISDAVL